MIKFVQKIFLGMRWWSGLSYNFLALASTIFFSLKSSDLEIVKSISLFVLLFIAIRLIFLVNNIYDVREDSAHPLGVRKNPFVGLEEEYLFRIKIFAVFLTALLIIAFQIVFTNSLATLTYVALLILGITYSAPPRFKERPPLDIVSHSLYFGALIILVPAIVYKAALDIPIISLLIGSAIISISMELGNHVSDYVYDLRAGSKTFATRYGLEVSKKIFSTSYSIGIALLSYFIYPSISYTIIGLVIGIILARVVDILILSKTCGPILILAIALESIKLIL